MSYPAYERVRNLNRLEHLLKADARFMMRVGGVHVELTPEQLRKYLLCDLLDAIRERRLTTLPPA